MIEIRKGQALAALTRLAFGERYRTRNDGTCPVEVSKTWRLTEIAQQVVHVERDIAGPLAVQLLPEPRTCAKP